MLHSYEKILLMKQQDTEKQDTIDIIDFLRLVWNGKAQTILCFLAPCAESLSYRYHGCCALAFGQE